MIQEIRNRLISLSDEKYKIFRGANHRFSTLGHDPVLGLVFGTVNIMTNTITCIEKPVISTYHVKYESFKNPKIASRASTYVMFDEARKRLPEEHEAAYAALIRQIIHIGTDLYTPCGIALPGIEIILPLYSDFLFSEKHSVGAHAQIFRQKMRSQFPCGRIITSLQTGALQEMSLGG